MENLRTFEEFVNENYINEDKKEKFVLYTNPNNVTNKAYCAIGTYEVKDILSDARKYPGSYSILYQGKGTVEDIRKAKSMFSYSFNESEDEISNIDEGLNVKFQTWPEVENDLEFLGKDELTDEDTGIMFDNKVKFDTAYVNVKAGFLKDWYFAIYVNIKNQIMIQGNPEKGIGEIFHVINGNKDKAQKIADELVRTGKVSIK
jgi:hypothetical protein